MTSNFFGGGRILKLSRLCFRVIDLNCPHFMHKWIRREYGTCIGSIISVGGPRIRGIRIISLHSVIFKLCISSG